MVTDPTGSPLNLRRFPNGRILAALKNGQQVRFIDQVTDRGKAWALVHVGSGPTARKGYVFREFVSCY